MGTPGCLVFLVVVLIVITLESSSNMNSETASSMFIFYMNLEMLLDAISVYRTYYVLIPNVLLSGRKTVRLT